MAFTLDQLETLEAAIASGTKKVKYADKEVEYNSIQDMLTLRDLIRKELGLIGKTKRFFVNFAKGTNSSDTTN